MASSQGDGEAKENQHQAHQGHQAHQALAVIVDPIVRQIVDAGLTVHRILGPGLFESTYEHCLVHELETRSIAVRRQVAIPIVYKGVKLEAGYRIDLVVEGCVIVEIKSIEALTRLHEAQLLTYLRLSSLRVGLLMNFNVPLFKNGLRRLVL